MKREKRAAQTALGMGLTRICGLQVCGNTWDPIAGGPMNGKAIDQKESSAHDPKNCSCECPGVYVYCI